LTSLTGEALISAALERLGAKDPQNDLSAEDAAQGLGVLRRMVGLWNTKTLLPPVRQRSVFSITASDGNYTIGEAGHTPDFAGDRLRFLEAAAVIASGEDREHKLGILTPQRYQAESDKGVTQTGMPQSIYVEPTVPVATITLFPPPSATMTLVLYYKPLIAQFTDLVTGHYFDEGYEAALVSNLAVWLAGPFRINVNEDPMLLAEAADTRGAIASLNEGPEEMAADPNGYFSDADSGWLMETGE